MTDKHRWEWGLIMKPVPAVSGDGDSLVQQPGGTLTFGDQMFTWEELDAAAGSYLLGFIVEDLDGNAYQVYTEVTVQ